jgi:hypothetical protein
MDPSGTSQQDVDAAVRATRECPIGLREDGTAGPAHAHDEAFSLAAPAAALR